MPCALLPGCVLSCVSLRGTGTLLAQLGYTGNPVLTHLTSLGSAVVQPACNDLTCTFTPPPFLAGLRTSCTVPCVVDSLAVPLCVLSYTAARRT